MKRVLSILMMVIAIALNVSAQSDNNVLKIKYADGTTTKMVPLSDDTKLIFEDENLNVISTSGELNIPYDEIASMFFAHYEYTTGDVNGDGTVDISDINAVIAMICGTSTSTVNSSDINGDGDIDISDVNAIIKLICN